MVKGKDVGPLESNIRVAVDYNGVRLMKVKEQYDEKNYKTEAHIFLEKLGVFNIYCTDYCNIL